MGARETRCGLIAGMMLAAACTTTARAGIAVGAKAELRHALLAHVTAHYLDAKGIQASVHPGFSAATLWGAQQDGVVDLAWESVGIALTTRHDMEIAAARKLDRESSIARLRAKAADGPVAWPAVSKARGGPVVAARADTADALDSATIAALLRHLRRQDDARFGMTTGFAGRPDGIRALAAAAPPPVARDSLRRMPGEALVAALRDGTLTGASLPRNDARTHADGLIVLRDERGAFPDHTLAVGVRRATLDKHPALADHLRTLAKRIDGGALRELTGAVVREDTGVSSAARAFLRRTGLIEPATNAGRDG
ncbi:osmoprotectant transport system substrate-binding protein/osmoprotectant transport system permease protein [Limimonas halophila]|uniref:Osmoprotectant transport system substrate-binding protein/osmoprotectant transport system permease protein n=1 Tax=Limimonas halophila TaxID=1082479 RepID=A0A1G7QMR0_9PROT|nr:glycine betaine ABC transporter substrate-binding protein [Limimonas halophila]SDF99796.1 osmoprotectant transport system substrate-binding protein/osmoprotectant transport system permease protein [Limimonas halophila]